MAPFEQQTGVKVNVELVGWDVQFDRIRNAAVSGEGPDVTQAGTTQVPFFAALGGFENIADRAGQIGGESAYAPGIWKTTQVEGQDGTWAVPWFTEARTIYYRKDALQKAGVDQDGVLQPGGAQQTLEQLKSVKEIGGEPIAPFGGPGKKAFDLVHHLMPWVWDSGGAELNADNTKSTINSPQAVQGVKFATDLVGAGLWDKSSSSATASRSRTSSRAAAWRSSSAARGSCSRPSAPTTTPGRPPPARTSGWRRCRAGSPTRDSRSSAGPT